MAIYCVQVAAHAIVAASFFMSTDHTTLIEPVELEALIADPNVAIIDCRHDLARPLWGAQAYMQGHIPGAQFAHLDRDLSGSVTAHTGRHPLPPIPALLAMLCRFGIDEHVRVVAYDQHNGAIAARLWWLLRWLGHPGVSVLNGGLAAWSTLGLPLERTSVARAPRHFRARPDAAAAVSTREIEQALAGDEILLVDARAADRFAGRNETLDPVAGHVPGAINHPFASNLDAQGRFLAAAELRALWRKTLAGRDSAEVVVMCGSGVTACHDLLALEIAGLFGARLYAGSWSEWIRDPARPVATQPSG
jgi:thiosulfate/3-mercaptopyruvate sulfurtransferase